jgi:hypothetical protein
MESDPGVRARRGVAWAGLVFLALYAGFVAYVVTSSAALPQRVATHFNAAGRADGWMSRSGHVTAMLAGGLAVPLIVVGVMFAARFASDDFVNVPHKGYWLAEGRRTATFDYLLRHAVWLGCWLILLFVGLQYLVLEANGRVPPMLGATVAWLIGGFVLGVAAWIVALAWHFARPPSQAPAANAG